jgi:hypothetical protein
MCVSVRAWVTLTEASRLLPVVVELGFQGPDS